MVQISDVITATEKFRQASGERHDALATLTGLTRALIKSEIPQEAVDFVDGRAAELLPGGGFEGRVSLHVLLSALSDAVRVGQRIEREKAGSSDG